MENIKNIILGEVTLTKLIFERSPNLDLSNPKFMNETKFFFNDVIDKNKRFNFVNVKNEGFVLDNNNKKINPKDTQLSIEIEMVVPYEFDKKVTKDFIDVVAYWKMPEIVYPHIKEQFILLCHKAKLYPIILPELNFEEIYFQRTNKTTQNQSEVPIKDILFDNLE